MTDKKASTDWKAEAGDCHKEKAELEESVTSWQLLASQWRDRCHEIEDELVKAKASVNQLLAAQQQTPLLFPEGQKPKA